MHWLSAMLCLGTTMLCVSSASGRTYYASPEGGGGDGGSAEAGMRVAEFWERAEAGEGIAWFLEKRTPSWQKPDA